MDDGEAAAQAAFVHLRVHTEYSLTDGLASPKALAGAAASLGMAALAVTERGNLFSSVRAYRACMGAGVKPLLGCDVALARVDGAELSRIGGPASGGAAAADARLLLIAQHHKSFKALSRLVSRTYVESATGADAAPRLQRDWLHGETDGLIALVGREGEFGELLLAGRLDDARAWLAPLMALFPDRLYLELTRIGVGGEEAFNAAACLLASDLDLPIVATNDVRFLAEGDFEAHEARVCINEGRRLDDARRNSRYTPSQCLRSASEMAELFHDLPEALANSVEIARRCNLDLPLDQAVLPDFPVPEGYDTASWLRQASIDGLERQLDRVESIGRYEIDRPEYFERLDVELDVINGTGFPGYFLIVADFIAWAKNNDVPVGPGRGSGAGSVVAWALGIIDIDPIKHDLLFERFLNAERVSMPDFDIDFCMERREKVLDYVAETYAGDANVSTGARVSQIVTFGTMAARAVVRDVGRVLGHPFPFCDQLAKLVPFQIGITLAQALEAEPALKERYTTEDDVRELIDLARKLEGIARNAGKHAGGVVIAPTAITDFAALYCEPGGGGLVTQLDKNDVESAGLVKFDFLGLRTLTIIDRAVNTINAERKGKGEELLDIGAVPDYDEPTFELVRTGKTTGVFQLESRGMQELVKRLEPDRFGDLVALVALFRPGPLQSGMVDDFIERKHSMSKGGGGQDITYIHDSLEPVLKATYGVILYQEQVMQIAQVLAGYTLGGADQLRRAMGKKNPAAMAEHRPIFCAGAKERGVDEKTALGIFELMAKFAEYGFNKSHSAAYAVLTFHTAWLKCHYPAAFMCAVLTADMDDTDKVVVMIDESRDLGLKVLPPDVNACAYEFHPDGPGAIRYGLGAVKGVGQGAVQAIIDERERDGEYADLFDFCRRVDLRALNRRSVEALIRAGAMDSIGPSRPSLMASLERALQAAEQHHRDANSGQDDLFGGATASHEVLEYTLVQDWREAQRLSHEREALGLYLSGHPINPYVGELRELRACRLAELDTSGHGHRLMAGWVVDLRVLNGKRGRMAFLNLDDMSARVELRIPPRSFEACRHLLTKDRLVLVEGKVEADRMTGATSVTAERLLTLDEAREARARRLQVRIDPKLWRGPALTAGPVAGPPGFGALREVLAAGGSGRVAVEIVYRMNGQVDPADITLPLGGRWRVRPSDDLLDRLRDLCGEGSVSVTY